MNITVDQYETSDFGLATAILTTGIKLVGVNKNNPRRVFFVFQMSKELTESIDNYWTGNLKLPANAFMDNVKYLKALIYE